MHLFYQPNIENCQQLSTTDSKHAIKVLRLKAGAKIAVVDGKGGYYEATIVHPDSKSCVFEIVKKEVRTHTTNYQLHIAIAPTKSIDRMEWFVEKATEIGINEITPILSTNSERKVIKKERIERVVIAAAKQSQTANFPQIHELTKFKDFLTNIDDDTTICIAYCGEETDKVPLDTLVTTEKKMVVMIGPEGDFTPNEVEIVLKKGGKVVSLGKSRLRTETAGVVAVHTVALMAEITAQDITKKEKKISL